MRRVWAAVLALWSTLAIVAVLAWSHPAPTAMPQASPVTVVLQGRNGQRHLARVFVLPAGSAAHAGTHSSGTTASTSGPSLASGASVSVSNVQTPAHVATGTS